MFLSYHMTAQDGWKFSERECFTVTYITNLVRSIHVLCVQFLISQNKQANP